MRQSSFKATSWLNQKPASINRSLNQPESFNTPCSPKNKSFQPSDFFTPGWSGGSLISKNGLTVRKILMKLWSDGVNQFRSLSQANRSLQKLIFEQFKSYCEENEVKINQAYLKTSEFLLQEISLPTGKMNPIVLDFVKISSFKSVTLYLYKVKFLSKLSDFIDIELDEQKIRNPSYFFQKIFKTTSQNNLIISSVQRNTYSWYRPSVQINLKITPIVKVLESISITELMKITSFSNYIKTQKTVYPHSISHHEFGKLMNELLIYFPDWIREQSNTEINKNLEVLTVNFSGAHVTSLSQSHWLAQNSSDPKKWRKLLFPNFTQQDKKDPYIRYCHELQFLSFLITLAKIYKKNPVKYIIQVYQEKEQSSHAGKQALRQIGLFDNLNAEKKNKTFQRIVLNLPNLPKKNPHHFLTSKIISQFSKISDDGFLIIMTNQKLFVPSYQEKVKQVLKVSNLEAEISLENLKNKGEVPDYIYIFSKNIRHNKFLSNELENNKSSYISFALEGTLDQFQLLQIFSQELQFIWANKKPTTPIYQKDLARDFVLKFHQSVILDGKSLENENQSQNSITHPSFYKNLALNSLTLDNFFKIEALESKIFSMDEKSYLFTSHQRQDRAPYILIVHTPDYLANSIEIIHNDSLEAKKQQYGEAFYQYYGLTPLSRSTNINIFREYFNSSIGKQIIKLTLGGAATKIKSKIRSLLVPKKFIGSILPDVQLPRSFNILNSSAKDLSGYGKNKLDRYFNQFLSDSESLSQSDSSLVLSCLSHLKVKIQHINNDKIKKPTAAINLDDNGFLSQIMKLELNPIYPNNPDAYVEVNTNEKLALYSLATDFKIEKDQNGQNQIKIFVDNDCCLSIFSSEPIILFIHQLLKQFKSFKPSDILQTLKIPSATDLSNIIEEQSGKEKLMDELKVKIDDMINSIITKLIL